MRRTTLRWLLLAEGASLVLAALIHFGVLATGYEHALARLPEMIIGGVLLLGWASTLLWPQQWRPIFLAAQVFGLLGTLVGVGTIAIGIGPRTVPDLVYHAILLVVLVWGLVLAVRAPAHEGVPA